MRRRLSGSRSLLDGIGSQVSLVLLVLRVVAFGGELHATRPKSIEDEQA